MTTRTKGPHGSARISLSYSLSDIETFEESILDDEYDYEDEQAPQVRSNLVVLLVVEH